MRLSALYVMCMCVGEPARRQFARGRAPFRRTSRVQLPGFVLCVPMSKCVPTVRCAWWCGDGVAGTCCPLQRFCRCGCNRKTGHTTLGCLSCNFYHERFVAFFDGPSGGRWACRPDPPDEWTRQTACRSLSHRNFRMGTLTSKRVSCRWVPLHCRRQRHAWIRMPVWLASECNYAAGGGRQTIWRPAQSPRRSWRTMESAHAHLLCGRHQWNSLDSRMLS